MKIAFFDLRPEDKDFLEKNMPKDELDLFEESVSDKLLQKTPDVEIISFRDRSKLNKKQAEKLPNLKLIANRTTGFDNVEKSIYERGDILLCNVPAYGASTVAEYVFAHILNISRKISKSILTHDNQLFEERSICGIDLEGKTIGIIGAGKIGFNVARIASGFNMKVIGYDIFQNQEVAKKYNLQYCELEDLLKQSDIISLNLPLTPETRYIINMDSIKKIKKGTILINTGRGALIDVRALIWALDRNILFGVGLDVLEGEDIIFKGRDREKIEIDDHNLRLLKYDNVIITPHNAFNSCEAYQRIMETTVENIKAYKKGSAQNLIV